MSKTLVIGGERGKVGHVGMDDVMRWVDDVMRWLGIGGERGKSRPCWMGEGYDVISASDLVNHLSNFFDDYFYFIWHKKKKRKIAGPARVSRRARLVLS